MALQVEQTSTDPASFRRQPVLGPREGRWWRRAARSQELASLVHLLDGALIGKRILGGALMHLGRDPAAGIVLLSARASRQHAILHWVRGAWVMVDNSSRHGILLDGIRVHSVVLREGDILQLGDDILTYTL